MIIPDCPRHNDGKHQWKMGMHLDGCHFFSSGYRCSCGATLSVQDERDCKADPYSMVWMEPQYVTVNRDEHGRFCKPHQVEKRCLRCQEIIDGALIRRSVVFVAKDGEELSETITSEQKPYEDDDEDEEA